MRYTYIVTQISYYDGSLLIVSAHTNYKAAKRSFNERVGDLPDLPCTVQLRAYQGISYDILDEY